jgi:transposase
MVRKSKRRGIRAADPEFTRVHPNAAGIDVGSESHWVCVPEDRDAQSVREFASFTADLNRLADWLERSGIQTVAMESAGVYWIALYEILEARGFEVLLVNARHVRNVPGRKDDWLDCQWLQKLHSFGLLRGSFRPPAHIAALRTYVRYRSTLIEQSAAWTQRMQKALILMNLQLTNVVSDITGATGLRIIRAIVEGERDPHVLARYRDVRIRASEGEIAAALSGHYTEEHLFLLQAALAMYDVHQRQMVECDAQIERVLHRITEELVASTPAPPAPARSGKIGGNEPRIELRTPLFALTGGIDVCQLPGVGPYAALKLISEVGVDLTRWKSSRHFVSWLTLSPNSKISGGKLLSSRTRTSANRAAALFRICAMALGRGPTALGAFYRRLAFRIGKAKALTATARKLAVLFYRLLTGAEELRQLSAAHYDAGQRGRAVRSLARRAHVLGLALLDPASGCTVPESVS